MENEELHSPAEPQMDDGIDFLELAGRLWKKRKLIIWAGVAGAVLGLVVAFSIPKKYTVTVTLSPESGKSVASGLASAAAMFGISNAGNGSDDALNISLFPEIMSSDPFALELYDMQVTTVKDESMPLNAYMQSQREPWWRMLLHLPGKLIGLLHKSADEDPEHVLNPFRLSGKEAACLDAIKKSMLATVDKKTSVTTISVTLQDPLVTATVADSVVNKLQEYITAYRTKKAVADCEYLEMLCRERQQEYYAAQQRYAAYVDGNKSLYSQRAMVEGERLQNDMNQAYQIYSQVSSQLQVARTKIQEDKPIFAVVNPATVPVRAAAPRKTMILAGFIFLACAAAAAWVLFGEGIWNAVRTLTAEDAPETEKKNA